MLAHSQNIKDPDVSVVEPFISMRALSYDEVYGLDVAVKELFFNVRGAWPKDYEWSSFDERHRRHREIQASSNYPERETNRSIWTLQLQHFTGAKVIVSKLLNEQLHQRELMAAKTPSNLYREIVMGDTFKNISNSSVVNRSTFFNAINALESKSDESLMELLEKIAEKVEASGNAEAGEILEQLMEELTRETPRKSLIRRSWDALTGILPDVAKIAEAGDKIGKLLT